MRYFRPDPFTSAGVAIPDMSGQSAYITAGDICNRRLMASIPQGSGTNALLERGAAGGVEWMECPDDLWAEVGLFLQGIESGSVTQTAPAGYARNNARPRMARFTNKSNLLAITDSLGWNDGGGGVNGTDSYVTQAFQAWAGPTRTPWQGDPAAEYVTSSRALLHNGNGGSFFEGGDIDDFGNDHERMRPVKYTTLGLTGDDIIYVALGTNDFSNTTISGVAPTAAQVWARAQIFVSGLVASFPNTKIIMATLPRRSENVSTNTRISDYNNLLKSGYAALGVTAICDIEQAHPNFSTSTGDSTGAAYLDGTHFSNIGIAAAAAYLEATLNALPNSAGAVSGPLAPYFIEATPPAVVSDFVNDVYGVNGAAVSFTDITANFTRSSTGTYIDAAGNIATAQVDQPRIDHDPNTLARKGLLIEGWAVNYLRNSAVLSTQTVAVSDLTEYVLHFTGTGSVTLSGDGGGQLDGVGNGEGNRVHLVFQTTGTAITFTVTGDVRNAQLELGGIPTSYIPTGNSTASRNRDNMYLPYNSFGLGKEHTIVCEFDYGAFGTDPWAYAFELGDGSAANRIALARNGADNSWAVFVRENNVSATFVNISSSDVGRYKAAIAVANGDFAYSLNGAAPVLHSGPIVPPITALYYARIATVTRHIIGLNYYNRRLSNAGVQSLSVL